jgi:Rrf2 family protein
MAANTNFAVAVHALSVLAHMDDVVKSDLIAESINTNPVVVRRLLSRLVRADLVRSVRGQHGGFALARPAKKIRLIDVLEAIEENELFRMHENAENPKCGVSCGIKSVLADVMDRVDAAVVRELSKTNLADVLRELT